MTQLEKIRAVVERVAASEGLEVVEVELHGRGRGTVVRIFLDKLAGAVPARLEVPESADPVLPELAVEPIDAAEGTAAQAASTGVVGVSLADCQNVSRQVGMILDVEEVMLDSYTLEVSSPGMDRKLVKPADYERFAGQRVAMELAPEAAFVSAGGIGRRFRGKLLGLRDGLVQVELDNGESRQISPNDIERANLVPEFLKKEKPGKGPGKGQSKGQRT